MLEIVQTLSVGESGKWTDHDGGRITN